MNGNTRHAAAREPEEHIQIRRLSSRLSRAEDLDPLIRAAAGARYLCLGEASPGRSTTGGGQ